LTSSKGRTESKPATDAAHPSDQDAPTAQPGSHPQAKVCTSLKTAANGAQQNNPVNTAIANGCNGPSNTPSTPESENGNHAEQMGAGPLERPPAAVTQSETPDGMGACSAQLDAFGAMCGLGNKQKLEIFLQLIFDFQQVGMIQYAYQVQ